MHRETSYRVWSHTFEEGDTSWAVSLFVWRPLVGWESYDGNIEFEFSTEAEAEAKAKELNRK
jgi:hypothetical protein